MNDSDSRPGGSSQPSREDLASALFASLVMQTTNMALLFLGKVPHPETGQTETDLDSARLFIDQLEMLELKTRGNLSADEQKLLKQNLTALRLAFVETSRQAPAQPAPKAAGPEKPAPAPSSPGPAPAAPPEDPESRKKFSKKY